mmetsp:Transcript_13429/g.31725  ORF Transcript_13429/g.31725 Transcript_13429/m.31725 type:complete len:269 (-) Transcript_13429:29-835(-)
MGLSSLTVAMFALLGTAVLFSAWSLTWGGAEVVSSPGNGPAARARELAASGVARWQAHAVAASSSSAAALRCNSQYVREAAEWEDFATAKPADSLINRQIRHVLERVSNNRSEVMIGIANDVMMCTNPKTCWWGGGNILASFVDVLRRLSVDNYIIIALDDQTGDFCKRAGAPYIRVDLEVPDAQKGSRGANMISTLKYDLLADVMLMGYSVLCVDLDIVFLRNPFDHLHRDADLEGSSDGFSAGWTGGQISSILDRSMVYLFLLLAA